MRIIAACVLTLLLVAGGCREVPLPDAGVETSTDPRAELVIQGWEREIGNKLTNSCRLSGLRLVCDW